MKQLLVISGKGGTGKTVLTASFAALAKNAVLADCDVDAADLHLLLHPQIKERYEFKSGKTAKIDKKICEQCGKCIAVCRFEAISQDFKVDPISCEGCAVCSYICPVNAISMQENICGEWFVSQTKYGPMVHAKLGIAQENSGKLVTVVRQKASEIAKKDNKDIVIIDGPPGIGCPVIASMANVDLALVVTEPTLSGIHDMKRVIEVAQHFGVKTKVAINKYDINLDNTEEIAKICKTMGIEVAAKISFSKDVNKALVNCVPIVEYCDGKIKEEIVRLWEKI